MEMNSEPLYGFYAMGKQFVLDNGLSSYNSWPQRRTYIVATMSGVPEYVRERVAMLNLLDEDVPSPLGYWGAVRATLFAYNDKPPPNVLRSYFIVVGNRAAANWGWNGWKVLGRYH